MSNVMVSVNITKEALEQAVRAVIDPNTAQSLGSARAIKSVSVSSEACTVDIELGYPARSQFPLIREKILEAVGDLGRDDASAATIPLTVNVGQRIVPHTVQRGVKLLPNVKNIVAVASGKGGVGKSTTAVNLALALAAEGANVGILDADIYGPSQPMLLGISGRPESVDNKSMEPMIGLGLQANSIGFLIEQDNPMVWRGPMVSSALDQLLNQTNWHDLDYLIVDMPPGTGDIQLTLSQKVPVTGAVIVTTPQDLALLDARKGLKMFEKVGIPILGIVENMSTHICSNCGHAEAIFGEGGAEKMCGDYKVDFLGALPLDRAIRLQADAGLPTVAADPDSPLAEIYKAIARKVAIKIAEKGRDMTSRFPSIVVQNT